MQFDHEEFKTSLQSKSPDEVVGTMESQFTDPLATWVRQREDALYVAVMYENITVATSKGSVPYPTPRWCAHFINLLHIEDKGTFVEWKITAQQALALLEVAVQKTEAESVIDTMSEAQLIEALQPEYFKTPQPYGSGDLALYRRYTQSYGDCIIWSPGNLINLRNSLRLKRGIPIPGIK